MSNKLGRPKKIQSPEMLWELFEQYKKKIKENPFTVTDWVGGIAREVTRQKEKPLTMEGFEMFVYEEIDKPELNHYFANIEKRYTDFQPICSRIKNVIRCDQIEGGMTNLYNTSITQRLNGLTEKTENKVDLNGSLDITLNL